MSRAIVLVVLLLPASASFAQQPTFTPVRITVPAGYEVSLAAAPPLVAHPLMAGFDDRGRLYVAENAGLNLPRKELEAQLPNSVRRLEDTDGDGVFDKSTVFADKMVFPQGALWYEGSVYVASPPSIWKLTDTDDDGVADQREEIVDKFGYTGNAADIHGCFLGPAGRIYWCDGRHGHEIKDAAGNVVTQGKAARIFSCRPDGSDVQVHCGGGMDNPVEIDFTDTGDMLGTVNLMYLQRGDCLVHWLRGGVYPRDDQQACIDEFRYTGGLLGPVVDYGHVAVSGMTRYRSGGTQDAWHNNVFVTQFNTHKVVRTKLFPAGSSYQSETHDFLRGESDDFHPTDVLEDADGSLLIVDTGGWFRIGCPTSQIARPEILGAIYRIRRKGAKPIDDPRGLKIAWKDQTVEQLAKLLDDSRFAVRERAIDTLAQSKQPANDVLQRIVRDGKSEQAKLAAIEALARRSEHRTDGVFDNTFHDGINAAEPQVRLAAIHAVGETQCREASAALCKLLTSDSWPERRAAATALGKLRGREGVSPLLEALAQETDRALEHAVIAALLDIGLAESVALHLDHADPRVRRGALMVLDQLPDGGLTQAQLAGLLPRADAPLLAEIVRVAQRHPDWSGSFQTLMVQLLEQPQLSAEEQRLLRSALGAFGAQASFQTLMSAALERKSLPTTTRVILLETLRDLVVAPTPAPWQQAVTAALQASEPALVDAALSAAQQLGSTSFVAPLQLVARDTKRPTSQRVAALAALTRPGDTLAPADAALLWEQLQPLRDPLDRLAAARVLGRSRLTDDQVTAACTALAAAGPLEITSLAAMLEHCSSIELFERAVDALAKNQQAAKNIDPEWLAGISRRHGERCEARVRTLVAGWRDSDATLQVQLDAFDKEFQATGEPGRGKSLFFRNACAACHRIGDAGGRIGPDLTHIGARRTTRDLVEAIIAPSASQARGFESVHVEHVDGTLLTGVIASESSQAITLRLPDQTTRTLPRRDIESIAPSRVSLMPAGLERTLSRDEFADLIAYLRSLK